MSFPPDDRTFRREMATAYRSGWHFIDLATAVPHRGDSLIEDPLDVTRADACLLHRGRVDAHLNVGVPSCA